MNVFEYTQLTRKIAPLDKYVRDFFDMVELADGDYETVLVNCKLSANIVSKTVSYLEKIEKFSPISLAGEACSIRKTIEKIW